MNTTQVYNDKIEGTVAVHGGMAYAKRTPAVTKLTAKVEHNHVTILATEYRTETKRTQEVCIELTLDEWAMFKSLAGL